MWARLSPAQRDMHDEFLVTLAARQLRTPDIRDIKIDYGDVIPIFVYDSLMKGRSDSHELDDFLFMGEATTMEDRYILMKKTENIIMFDQNKELLAAHTLTKMDERRVQGEVYGVPVNELQHLDDCFKNNALFYRRPISVMLNQQPDTPIIRNTLCYFGVYDHWKKGTSDKDKFTTCAVRDSSYNHTRVYRGYDHNPPIDIELVDISGEKEEPKSWEDEEYDAYWKSKYTGQFDMGY